MENEGTDLRRYVALLWRWAWLVVVCTSLAAGTAFVASTMMIPVYSATVTLLVSQMSPNTNDYAAVMTAERLASTYSARLSERPVLETTIDRLGLNMDAGQLAGRLSAQPVRDTQLIRLSVEDTDPVRAAQIANTVPVVFIERNETMQETRYAESKANLEAEITQLAQAVVQTQAEIDALGTPATGEEEARLASLQTALAQYRSSYTNLLQSYYEIQVAEASASTNVIVTEPAEVPEGPVRPRRMQNTLLAGVIGAMLAVGVAFLVEYLDDTIKAPEDVARVLGTSVLGALRRMNGSGKGELITIDEPMSPLSEAFRKLRTNIRFSSIDRPARVILVTSPGPSDGKSWVTANLAAVMAQSGLKVVLVDADLRRPRQAELFGLHTGEGLTGALLSEGGLDGRLEKSRLSTLWILPAGELPPNPAETVGSQRMRDLLRQLREHVDVVLIDSPPVLPVTDALVLSGQVDGVLLVLDTGSTRREAGRQVVEGLRQVGAHLLGVVLNRVPTRGRGYYYPYYEYQRYAYAPYEKRTNGRTPKAKSREQRVTREQRIPEKSN